EARADHAPVPLEQLPVGFVAKQKLSEGCGGKRIDKSEEERGDDGERQGCEEILLHDASDNSEIADQEIDGLDAEERGDDSAAAVEQEIPAKECRSTEGAITHAAQGQRDQRNDDERVEDDGGKDGRLWSAESHDVEDAENGKRSGEHRGNDG